MAHDHHHHGNAYYLDQLCTIAACAALGGVAVMMYWLTDANGKSKLEYILAPQFFKPVLIGGIALLVLSAIRAVALWQEAGRATAHHHDHEHDHDHDHAHVHEHAHDHGHEHPGHDHAHHHHAHGHDHDHGWTPARYAVLMLPIVLYFLNLPNSSFSAERWGDLGSTKLEGDVKRIEGKDGKVINLGFKELSNAALIPSQREYYHGQTGRISGMYSPLGSDKEFTLFRVKMNCCAADAIPLEVRIFSQENLTRLTPKEWVEVEGQIQFQKVAGRDKFLPVVLVESADHVRKIPPQSDYEF
jgi:hypothetical protein